MPAGLAWQVVTLLVLPVILFEGKGVRDSLRRSASLIKERWGEGVTGHASIGIAMAVVMVPLMVVGTALVVINPAVGITTMVILILGTIVLSGVLSSVFHTALYRYAAAGEASAAFGEAQLQSTFVTKEQRQKPVRKALRIIGISLAALYLVVMILRALDVIPAG